jgi:hypothetical protein
MTFTSTHLLETGIGAFKGEDDGIRVLESYSVPGPVALAGTSPGTSTATGTLTTTGGASVPPSYTDRGKTQTAAGGFITMSLTTASFTPAAGSLLVVVFTADCSTPNDGFSGESTFVISSTFTDTGGGSWTNVAEVNRGAAAASPGHYTELNRIWIRQVGTSPSAGTINILGTCPNGSDHVSGDGWMWMDLIEVTGQNTTTPTGLTPGTTARVPAGPTTLDQSLGGTPTTFLNARLNAASDS